MSQRDILKIIAAEGEGQKVEFKAKMTGLANELVAFANASGGSVLLGISDDGKITGLEDSNRLRSQIQDIANGCDPRIPIRIISHGKVIEFVWKSFHPLKPRVLPQRKWKFANCLPIRARHR